MVQKFRPFGARRSARVMATPWSAGTALESCALKLDAARNFTDARSIAVENGPESSDVIVMLQKFVTFFVHN